MAKSTKKKVEKEPIETVAAPGSDEQNESQEQNSGTGTPGTPDDKIDQDGGDAPEAEQLEAGVIEVPSKRNFELTKMKFDKDGAVEIHYNQTRILGQESYVDNQHHTSALAPHPDLRKTMDRLTYIYARVFGFTDFLSVVETTEFKATEKQKKFAESYADEKKKNIEIRGVSFTGKGDKVKVIITGLLKVESGSKTVINTPNLTFGTETWGFEEDLENILMDLENEVYAYLFEGKRAQLSLFGSAPAQNESPKKKKDPAQELPHLDDPAGEVQDDYPYQPNDDDQEMPF